MINKTIRIWVYGLLRYRDKIIVIKKGRGPFKGLYDLPWWKIEHWETNIESLKRELKEEVWLKENDFEIEKLLTVEEDFIKHNWEWKEKDEHIIAIIYVVNLLTDDFNLNYIENWWDSSWIKLINIDDDNILKTNVLKKAIIRIKWWTL